MPSSLTHLLQAIVLLVMFTTSVKGSLLVELSSDATISKRASLVCGETGSVSYSPGEQLFYNPGIYTVAQCEQLCLDTPDCKTFFIATNGHNCGIISISTAGARFLADPAAINTFYDIGCFHPPLVCGIKGTVTNAPGEVDYETGPYTVAQCEALCFATADCESFALGNGGDWCATLTVSSAGAGFAPSLGGLFAFYDIGCFPQTPVCGTRGSVVVATGEIDNTSGPYTLDECTQLCLTSVGCQSFYLAVDQSFCATLTISTAAAGLTFDSTSDYYGYDITCFPLAPVCGKQGIVSTVIGEVDNTSGPYTVAQCEQICLSSAGCKSFYISTDATQCITITISTSDAGFEYDYTSFYFAYDMTCFPSGPVCGIEGHVTSTAGEVDYFSGPYTVADCEQLCKNTVGCGSFYIGDGGSFCTTLELSAMKAGFIIDPYSGYMGYDISCFSSSSSSSLSSTATSSSSISLSTISSISTTSSSITTNSPTSPSSTLSSSSSTEGSSVSSSATITSSSATSSSSSTGQSLTTSSGSSTGSSTISSSSTTSTFITSSTSSSFSNTLSSSSSISSTSSSSISISSGTNTLPSTTTSNSNTLSTTSTSTPASTSSSISETLSSTSSTVLTSSTTRYWNTTSSTTSFTVSTETTPSTSTLVITSTSTFTSSLATTSPTAPSSTSTSSATSPISITSSLSATSASTSGLATTSTSVTGFTSPLSVTSALISTITVSISSGYTYSTVYTTTTYTITKCPSTVTKCIQLGFRTTETVVLYTTYCPIGAITTAAPTPSFSVDLMHGGHPKSITSTGAVVTGKPGHPLGPKSRDTSVLTATTLTGLLLPSGPSSTLPTPSKTVVVGGGSTPIPTLPSLIYTTITTRSTIPSPTTTSSASIPTRTITSSNTLAIFTSGSAVNSYNNLFVAALFIILTTALIF